MTDVSICLFKLLRFILINSLKRDTLSSLKRFGKTKVQTDKFSKLSCLESKYLNRKIQEMQILLRPTWRKDDVI